jgi:Protein of unknown function (DUF2721)
MPVESVAHTIQLSVAPVFLLTALGTFMAVLSNRLGRIVDRARVLGDRLPGATGPSRVSLRTELQMLGRRRRLVNFAFTAAVTSALLVCAIIASLFVGSMLEVRLSGLPAVLFVAAMLAFIAALLLFLREIMMAVASVRIDAGP